MERAGLDLYPTKHTVLISHPQSVPTPQAGRVTDSGGGGRVRAGAGGSCYYAPTLLGAGEVKLVF
jgi:hypothetical protein